MSQWQAIPSFPTYVIAKDGTILDSNGEPVDFYMGRANVSEEKHRRVRLKDHRGYPIANSVEDLLEETFPDYQRPAKPIVVAEPVKREKKWVADRNSQARKTAVRHDPKDPSVEWRPIPGFSKYEINAKGDVWSAYSNRLITKKFPKDRLPSYHLYTNNMRKTNRAVQSLIDLAFPELITPKPLKAEKDGKELTVRRNRGRNAWFDIPGFDQYQVSKDGALRYKSNKQILPTVKDGQVRLTRTFTIQELLELTFTEEAEAA